MNYRADAFAHMTYYSMNHGNHTVVGLIQTLIQMLHVILDEQGPLNDYI